MQSARTASASDIDDRERNGGWNARHHVAQRAGKTVCIRPEKTLSGASVGKAECTNSPKLEKRTLLRSKSSSAFSSPACSSSAMIWVGKSVDRKGRLHPKTHWRTSAVGSGRLLTRLWLAGGDCREAVVARLKLLSQRHQRLMLRVHNASPLSPPLFAVVRNENASPSKGSCRCHRPNLVDWSLFPRLRDDAVAGSRRAVPLQGHSKECRPARIESHGKGSPSTARANSNGRCSPYACRRPSGNASGPPGHGRPLSF